MNACGEREVRCASRGSVQSLGESVQGFLKSDGVPFVPGRKLHERLAKRPTPLELAMIAAVLQSAEGRAEEPHATPWRQAARYEGLSRRF